MDDLTIKRDVEAELQWEPSINAAAIGVAVKDGIVTLTGRARRLGGPWSGQGRKSPHHCALIQVRRDQPREGW